MRWGLANASVGVALGVALLTSGCGGDDGPTVASDETSAPVSTSPSDPSSSAPTEPACSQIWVDGRHLARGYTGCSDNGVWVAAERHRCASGQVLVSYGDRFYGALGAKVNDVGTPLSDSAQYHRAMRACD